MYNTTLQTKLTTRNPFPALFFNIEVAVVHKSKMAATTQPHQQVGPTFLNRNKSQTTLLAKRSLWINYVRGLSEIIIIKIMRARSKQKRINSNNIGKIIFTAATTYRQMLMYSPYRPP